MIAGRLTVAREWTRIGTVGFGGPPAHIHLLRELCVERRRWISAEDFEDAIAAMNLLPGPASTQTAIWCAWRVAGVPGALIGGAGFILPGLIAIIALAALFLADAPPLWVRGAGAGAAAAVAAVALHAAAGLVAGKQRGRWIVYAALGFAAAALAGPWVVLVLLACGAAELGVQRVVAVVFLPIATVGGLGALAWTAFKVGALSYGGGFVIIPLMQADAVETYGWMTDAQFLNAVALGQVTPGPVVHTVAAVGYAAAGIGGALLAAAVAFAPSFSFILLGAERFDRLRANPRVRAFLAGAGPAAIGAIAGSAVPLTLALAEPWQLAVLAGAILAMFALGRGVVATLLGAGAAGVAIALAGGPVP